MTAPLGGASPACPAMGEKFKRGKHPIVIDTNGFKVGLIVHGTVAQDHDGTVPMLH